MYFSKNGDETPCGANAITNDKLALVEKNGER